MKTRKAAVAGTFYPDSKSELSRLFTKLLDWEKPNINYDLAYKPIIGCVIPHAGYVYSGYEAIHFFEILKKSPTQYDTFIILNPNHTGYGNEVEADGSDAWETPLGKIQLDQEFTNKLGIEKSTMAQKHEHSAEVMLPFLQYCLEYPFRIVPICIRRQTPDTAKDLAKSIAMANEQLDRKLMVIASSDFSHFEHPVEGARKDDLVLEQIRDMNIDRLYNVVRDNNISVCGYGPIMTLMSYARQMTKHVGQEILARGHSGKTHPSNSVVDYISILFYNMDR